MSRHLGETVGRRRDVNPQQLCSKTRSHSLTLPANTANASANGARLARLESRSTTGFTVLGRNLAAERRANSLSLARSFESMPESSRCNLVASPEYVPSRNGSDRTILP